MAQIFLENKYENGARGEDPGDDVMISSSSPLADSAQLAESGPESFGWEIPEIILPYKLQGAHPMSKKLCQETHEWIAGHGVDKQLGPELWNSLLKENTPYLCAHVMPNVSDKVFLLMAKHCLLLFAVDAVLDDTPVGKDINKSLDAVLEVITVLMWKFPEEPSFVKCLSHIDNLASSETSKHSIDAFKAQLLEATHREECNLNLSPLASAWKDFWAEYIGVGLPKECNVRQAQGLLEWLTWCFQEAHYRSSGTSPGLEYYITLRQKTSAVNPAVVVTDLMVHESAPAGIPNSLFYSPPMQLLMKAVIDAVAWHNDIFSFYKECVVNDDKHNLVYIISHEQKCSQEAAAKFVVKMMMDRLEDMESAITDLIATVSADLQPAVEIYATTCRNWVSGTHEFHLKSPRFRALREPLIQLTLTA